MLIFDWNSKMATTTVQSFNIRPYRKMNKWFFSETRNLIEPKQYMNNHVIVPFKILIFMSIVNQKEPRPVQINIGPNGKII